MWVMRTISVLTVDAWVGPCHVGYEEEEGKGNENNLQSGLQHPSTGFTPEDSSLRPYPTIDGQKGRVQAGSRDS